MPSSTAAADTNEGMMSLAVIADYIPTFGAVLGQGELAALLDEPGPFTVFVPAEGAFAGMPSGTLDGLMEPGSKAARRAMLGSHIVRGRIAAADLKDQDTLVTVEGTSLAVRRDAGGLTINGARVMAPDIEASNGVMHVVRAVLVPVN